MPASLSLCRRSTLRQAHYQQRADAHLNRAGHKPVTDGNVPRYMLCCTLPGARQVLGGADLWSASLQNFMLLPMMSEPTL